MKDDARAQARIAELEREVEEVKRRLSDVLDARVEVSLPIAVDPSTTTTFPPPEEERVDTQTRRKARR